MKTQAKQYQESRILTAPKEDLLVMLLEGAVRFAEQGKALLVEKKFEESCRLFIRTQRILVELMSSLDEKLLGAPMHASLMSLYYFVYWRFVRASVDRSAAMADEGLKILDSLRETWTLAVEKDRKERRGGPSVPAVAPPAPAGGIDLGA
ncbi:MAG: flagellar protein FliS [Planctomycetes bacterium]|nr:flagellar protein FliS [Planctomycetota bacterium]